MADFNIQPVATQIKPMQGISLGDMVDLARGVQAYKQAEQVNPYLAQIREQEARTGQINLGLLEQQNIERQKLQSYLSDPSQYTRNGEINIEKMTQDVSKFAPLLGQEVISKYTTLAGAQTQANEAKQKLTQDQRNLVGSTFYVLGRAGIKDKNAYFKAMDDLVEQNPNNDSLKRLAEAYKTTWNTMPPNTDWANFAVQGAQTLMGKSFEPTISVSPEGVTTTIQQVPGVSEPRAKIGFAEGVQTGAPPAAEPAAAPTGAGMTLPYPVRRAEQRFIPEPSEEKDKQAGIEYRNNLVGRQVTLATDRRNVDETIRKANQILQDAYFQGGGVAGKVEQKIRMAISDVDYAALAKDLANLQISNAKALGQTSSTVAGLDLTKVASGDINVPPKVLIEIARRTQADMTNIDMQAQGAENFKRRFGDNNMNAFKQAWNANADTKIFEAMNIERDITDPAAQRKAFEKLFPTDAARKEALKKMRNLQKLATTGGL